MAFGLTSTASLKEALATAESPDTARTELAALSLHRNPKVRSAIATRQDTPIGALISLAHDNSDDVLSALIANPAAPTTLLHMLCTHPREHIQRAAQARARAL